MKSSSICSETCTMIQPNTADDKEHLKRWHEALTQAHKDYANNDAKYEDIVANIHREFMSQYESSEQINALVRLYTMQGLVPENPPSDTEG
ncbi:MAG: hypothetical protein AAGB26_00740 [Planctomycetota bacterium]